MGFSAEFYRVSPAVSASDCARTLSGLSPSLSVGGVDSLHLALIQAELTGVPWETCMDSFQDVPWPGAGDEGPWASRVPDAFLEALVLSGPKLKDVAINLSTQEDFLGASVEEIEQLIRQLFSLAQEARAGHDAVIMLASL